MKELISLRNTATIHASLAASEELGMKERDLTRLADASKR